MSHKLFCHSMLSNAQVWAFLKRIDAVEAETCRAAGCPRCGGDLHSASCRHRFAGQRQASLRQAQREEQASVRRQTWSASGGGGTFPHTPSWPWNGAPRFKNPTRPPVRAAARPISGTVVCEHAFRHLGMGDGAAREVPLPSSPPSGGDLDDAPRPGDVGGDDLWCAATLRALVRAALHGHSRPCERGSCAAGRRDDVAHPGAGS